MTKPDTPDKPAGDPGEPHPPSRWRGVDQWLRQQSAFTIGDLLNVARAGEPYARLEHIYEWYFARTMTAIRVAFGAAVAASGAIYGLAVKDPGPAEIPHHELLSRGLAVAAIVCVVSGVIQRRELAQLHREFAAALRLLSDVRQLPEHVRSAADGQLLAAATSKRRNWRGIIAVGGAVVVVAAALGIVIGFGGTPTVALTVLTGLVLVLVGPHIVVETLPQNTADIKDTGEALEKVVGHIRLDEYALNPSVTTDVNRAIKERRPIEE